MCFSSKSKQKKTQIKKENNLNRLTQSALIKQRFSKQKQENIYQASLEKFPEYQNVLSSDESPSKQKTLQNDINFLNTQDIINAKSQQIIQHVKYFKNIFHCPVQDKYFINSQIGQGACGLVFLGTCKITGKKVAIKVMNIENRDSLDDCLSEVEILYQLDHPNIMKILQIFKTDQQFCIICEYYNGPSLKTYIKSKNHLSEAQLADILKQILKGLNYLRKKQIVHQDIKADNIIFSNEDSNQIKIIDFGFAYKIKSKSQSSINTDNLKGTPYYFAPENLQQNQPSTLQQEEANKLDIWSLGVLTYWMITQEMPFNGSNFKELFTNILASEPNFNHPNFSQYSLEFKDFLKSLLEKNLLNRISVKKALKSTWIKQNTQQNYKISQNLIDNFKTFLFYQNNQQKPELTFEVIKFICNNIINKESNAQIQKIIKSFFVFDVENKGKIKTSLVFKAIQTLENYEEFATLLKNQKFLSNYITFSDFIAIFMPLEEVVTEQNIKYVFKLLDFKQLKTIHVDQIEGLNPILKYYHNSKQNINQVLQFDQFIKLFL